MVLRSLREAPKVTVTSVSDRQQRGVLFIWPLGVKSAHKYTRKVTTATTESRRDLQENCDRKKLIVRSEA